MIRCSNETNVLLRVSFPLPMQSRSRFCCFIQCGYNIISAIWFKWGSHFSFFRSNGEPIVNIDSITNLKYRDSDDNLTIYDYLVPGKLLENLRQVHFDIKYYCHLLLKYTNLYKFKSFLWMNMIPWGECDSYIIFKDTRMKYALMWGMKVTIFESIYLHEKKSEIAKYISRRIEVDISMSDFLIRMWCGKLRYYSSGILATKFQYGILVELHCSHTHSSFLW